MILEHLLNDSTASIVENNEMTIPDYLLNDPEIVGYPDIDMQFEIYAWASDGVDLSKSNILDVGCGRADFGHFLVKKIDDINYIGVDKNVPLILAGREKYSDINKRNMNLFDGDIYDFEFDEIDHSFVIGTLNSMPFEDFDKMFNKLYSISKKSIIFIVNRDSESDTNLYGFPFSELFKRIPRLNNLPFIIDHTRFDGIYKLIVFK